MGLDAVLLSVLACPEDKGPLWFVESESILYNPRLRRAYRVVDGIPVMLVEESVTADESEHARISAIIDRDGIKPTFEV